MTQQVRLHDAVEQYLAQRHANCAPHNSQDVSVSFGRETWASSACVDEGF